MRGMFLKIVLWFWASLALVALALHVTIIATSVPPEVRVQRFSDTALSGYGAGPSRSSSARACPPSPRTSTASSARPVSTPS